LPEASTTETEEVTRDVEGPNKEEVPCPMVEGSRMIDVP